ncbi:response regulator [Candidatus Saccharibacteria bacterium]|nr:response regulator [Candidatus Saccharibacteria bacterium]
MDQTSSSGKKILCIEDEHFISELYVRALSKAGYNVAVAVDGEDGLKQALTDNFDIILLDIMIPTITGIEILKRLRDPNNQNQIRAKIIITTNLEQGIGGREEIEKQADGYVIKAEITPRQLVEFVNQLET